MELKAILTVPPVVLNIVEKRCKSSFNLIEMAVLSNIRQSNSLKERINLRLIRCCCCDCCCCCFMPFYCCSAGPLQFLPDTVPYTKLIFIYFNFRTVHFLREKLISFLVVFIGQSKFTFLFSHCPQIAKASLGGQCL